MRKWFNRSGNIRIGRYAGRHSRGVTCQGNQPALATIWAVYMHGEAGCRLAKRGGTVGLLAREIPGEIPGIMQELGDPSTT